MVAPLALPFDPVMRFTLPALLCDRSRRQRPLRRDWLRIADRLAAGLPPAAAALPEGGDEAMVAGLLQREDFQALVEIARAWHEDSDEAARRKLVVMARQALARAMDWEDDPRAALFVLDEEARGRDPAATVAAAVLKRPRRAPAPTDGIRSRPPRLHDPMSALCARTRRRLADEVRGEAAIRHATAAGRTTAEAAKRALALRQAARNPQRADAPRRHARAGDPSGPGAPVPRPAGHGPRCTRGP